MTLPPNLPLVPTGTYEPKCLERWSESVAGMDDMGEYADPARQVTPVGLASEAGHA